MDINQTLTGLVDTLSKQILEEVSARVDQNIESAINSRLEQLNMAERIDVAARAEAKTAAAQYTPNFSAIDRQLESAAGAIINNVTATADRLVQESINSKIAAIDFENSISVAIAKMLADRLKEYRFPDASISSKAIDFAETISGDAVAGGVA